MFGTVQTLPTAPLGQSIFPLVIGLPAVARLKVNVPALAEGVKIVRVSGVETGSISRS